MKKAFCESGNVDFCPPLALAQVFGLEYTVAGGNGGKKLEIVRSEENGGNRTYTTMAELHNDFQSGALHPGDLKTATTTLMVHVLTKLSQGLSAQAAQELKTLKAFHKKAMKASKK